MNPINYDYLRKLYFQRLSEMTNLCNQLGVPYQAGEFGITVNGEKTFPLDCVLDAKPFIYKIANRKAGKLDGWF